ncbi:AdeC/AdeK/OprM family multidrug efflux complex outer membrane factor [soil metagenome]
MAAVATLMVLALAGCGGVPASDRPSAALLVPASPSPWREDFGDPVLRDLLRRADLANLDVKTALARLELANADAALAHADRALRVQIGVAGAIGGETFSRARAGASPTLETVSDVDLWGGLRQGGAAARSEIAAVTADIGAARSLVAAQTVTAYVALRAAQGGQGSAERRSAIASRRLDMVRTRAANGAADADAVMQAEVALAETVAARHEVDEEVLIQLGRLKALVGERGDLQLAAAPLPELPRARAVEVGSDSVDARPEVQAAFARLHAADARRAQLLALTRPQFQVVAALGAPDAAISTLLDVRALAWAVAGTLTHTMLDGGAGRARVARASAEADVAELAWRKAVLDGWIDIQMAVIRLASAETAEAASLGRLGQSRTHLALVERRHDEGVADGVAVADAQMALEEADLALAQARSRVLASWIQRRWAAGEPT